MRPVAWRAGTTVPHRLLALQARLGLPGSGSGCENGRAARFQAARGGGGNHTVVAVRTPTGAAGGLAGRNHGSAPPPGADFANSIEAAAMGFTNPVNLENARELLIRECYKVVPVTADCRICEHF